MRVTWSNARRTLRIMPIIYLFFWLCTNTPKPLRYTVARDIDRFESVMQHRISSTWFKTVYVSLAFVCTLYVAAPSVQANYYMPHSFISVDTSNFEAWRPVLKDAALEAVEAINLQTEDKVSFEEVELEGTRVGSALVFSGTVETVQQKSARPESRLLQMSFLQPPQSLAYLWTISGESSPVIPPKPSDIPSFPELEVEGPLVLHLSQVVQDPEIKLPRHVEVGPVQFIRIAEGVKVSISGFAEVELKDSLDLDDQITHRQLRGTAAEDNDDAAQHKPSPSMKQHLQLRLQLTKNAGRDFRISSPSRFKVKRRSGLQIELLPLPGSSITTSSSSSSFDDSPRQDIAISAHQTGRGPNPDNKFVVSPESLARAFRETFSTLGALPANSRAQRIVSGKAQAVTALVLPVRLKQRDSGHVDSWQLVLARSPPVDGASSSSNRLFSYHRLDDNSVGGGSGSSLVSFTPGLLHNTTWPAVLHSFSSSRQNTD